MRLSLRARKWVTLAVVAALASVAPILVLLGRTAVQRGAPMARRALVFEAEVWRAETGRLVPAGYRGLMVPGLLASGRLVGLPEAEVRALLGEPDCPSASGGPFAGGGSLAYWVGEVGSASRRRGEPPPPPGCLHLRLVEGKVVDWRVVPAGRPDQQSDTPGSILQAK